VAALAERLDGNRSAASAALDGLLDVIVRTVRDGDSVSLAGFGVFERRERAARTGRNPRTGQRIELAATIVPAFRPAAMFREVVSGARELFDPSARPVRDQPAARSAVRRRASAPLTSTGGRATRVAYPEGDGPEVPARPAEAAEAGAADGDRAVSAAKREGKSKGTASKGTASKGTASKGTKGKSSKKAAASAKKAAEGAKKAAEAAKRAVEGAGTANVTAEDGSATTAGYGSAKNGSAKNGSAKNGSAKHGSAKHGSAKHGSAKNGSAKNGSAKHGSAKNGSAKRTRKK
jgi:DNA-binding protein HU-beta